MKKYNRMSDELNGVNGEYAYVKKLISILTNDHSDNLIIEKLKGQSLSSLLFNAKIIDNSKNLATNKRVLGCILRAIQKEKYLYKKNEIGRSWGQKLLSSINCLIPVKTEVSISKRSLMNTRSTRRSRISNINCKRADISKRRKNRLTRTISKNVSPNKTLIRRKQTNSRVSLGSRNEESDKQVIASINSYSCIFYHEAKKYEVVILPNLCVMKPLVLRLHYLKPTIPWLRSEQRFEMKTSSTQTLINEHDQTDQSYFTQLNNIKLETLLEAACNLINSKDQREYIKTFLNNVEPPFDLSAGLPPYLKLPMNQPCEQNGKESIYGSGSDLSVTSAGAVSRQLFSKSDPEMKNIYKLKEDRVKTYVHDLKCNTWQETAESIISGVINEPLLHDKADYSQLGACILKRLGAYSGSYTENNQSKYSSTIPEIVLSCTEWFESGSSESVNKQELSSDTSHGKIQSPGSLSGESIQEINLIDKKRINSRILGNSLAQNLWAHDGGNVYSTNKKNQHLNLAERVLGKFCNNEIQDRGGYLHDAITVTPSAFQQNTNLIKENTTNQNMPKSCTNCQTENYDLSYTQQPPLNEEIEEIQYTAAIDEETFCANEQNRQSDNEISTPMSSIDDCSINNICETVNNMIDKFSLEAIGVGYSHSPSTTHSPKKKTLHNEISDDTGIVSNIVLVNQISFTEPPSELKLQINTTDREKPNKVKCRKKCKHREISKNIITDGIESDYRRKNCTIM